MVVCIGQELVLMPLSTTQVKPLGSTLLLTCQVTAGEEEQDYNLQWTALTDSGLRNIHSITGRFVLLRVWSHVTVFLLRSIVRIKLADTRVH